MRNFYKILKQVQDDYVRLQCVMTKKEIRFRMTI